MRYHIYDAIIAILIVQLKFELRENLLLLIIREFKINVLFDLSFLQKNFL